MIESLTTALQVSPDSALWVLILIGSVVVTWLVARMTARISRIEREQTAFKAENEKEHAELKEMFRELDHKIDRQTAQIAELQALIMNGQRERHGR